MHKEKTILKKSCITWNAADNTVDWMLCQIPCVHLRWLRKWMYVLQSNLMCKSKELLSHNGYLMCFTTKHRNNQQRSAFKNKLKTHATSYECHPLMKVWTLVMWVCSLWEVFWSLRVSWRQRPTEAEIKSVYEREGEPQETRAIKSLEGGEGFERTERENLHSLIHLL